jgi:glycerol-3-phosphate dehydrogenase (NAD(P)+)
MSAPAPTPPARPYDTIFVIGAGAWGTALAGVAAGNAGRVIVQAREPEVVTEITQSRENRTFLPGVTLPKNIEAVPDLQAIGTADAVLLVAPAQYVRPTASALRGAARPGVPIVLCAKGIEHGTGKLLIEVLAEVLPGSPAAVLSGPSFAKDVARGLPTAVTIAAGRDVAPRLQASLSRPGFRPYASDDLIGVALGGAAKNVYAIA